MSESAKPPLEITASRQFTSWLAETNLSIALSTYQAGKLFLFGLKADGGLSIFERSFNRAMGLAVHERQLYLATLFQLWRFDDLMADGPASGGAYAEFDRLFAPTLAWTTGDLDIHDIGIDQSGRPLFVATLFSCLARPRIGYSFEPVWRPPFITRLAAEDRCHLNGLAMKDGAPAFVTAVSRSDIGDGWRDRRRDGGVVIDVASGERVAGDLSMPHSPRLHDGKLWLIDSGRGRFGWLEPASGRFETVAVLPGYGRGLAMIGDYAVVGLSKPRGNKTFAGLELDEALTARDAEPRCGLWVIDLRSGDAVHWLRLEGVVEELYDVAVLAGARRPALVGLKTDEIRRLIRVAPPEAS